MITEINWKFQTHMLLAKSGQLMHRDNDLGVQMEIITRRNAYGEWGKGKAFYYIDGDDREFHTEDELIEAYNEKFKFEGENPEREVKYVRVVRKRVSGLEGGDEGAGPKDGSEADPVSTRPEGGRPNETSLDPLDLTPTDTPNGTEDHPQEEAHSRATDARGHDSADRSEPQIPDSSRSATRARR